MNLFLGSLAVFQLLAQLAFPTSALYQQFIANLDKDLDESSGIAYLPKQNYLVSHNDGGKADLFVMNPQRGNLIKKLRIRDTKNDDWEDLTTDPSGGRLFVGAFGNNDNDRRDLHVIVVNATSFQSEQDGAKLEALDKLYFRYEDQREFPPSSKAQWMYDCEAMFYLQGKLFLFTKSRAKPYSGESRVYELSAQPTKDGRQQVARYLGSLWLCNDGRKQCSVTGADYDPATHTVALLTNYRLYTLRNFPGNEFWRGQLREYLFADYQQREAIAYKNPLTFYLTNEQRKDAEGGKLYQVFLGWMNKRSLVKDHNHTA